ncbi:WD repeat protein [Pseudovirgaria hyperparasitica]|uniref:WD repeat protein n=1 Tax=Pseudovirgaria hyperparasitica TaxID=470096 RepID=A0A6A6WKT8_9PEZI|nr:WD repeat protein [Pseudovirgaria hyperparasitica]KAF2762786.1 WD repeat protein [Pseudovirgaria hyperparasitica]
MAAGPQASGAPPAQKVQDVITTFRPHRRFRTEPKCNITSIDFDDTGELVIVARDDDTLQLYNLSQGKHAKELKCQKYGVHLAKFSHHSQSIVHASSRIDSKKSDVDNHAIRYLTTHDNSYLRYFRGHTDTVTCIALSPSSDEFLSCSKDNSVRLWNLKSSNCQGMLKLHGAYLAAYDPSATVIAIASPATSSVLLYDKNNYDKAPFATFDLQPFERVYTEKSIGRGWTKIEFSNDGKSLLVATNGLGHFVLDAFEGNLTHFCIRRGKMSGRRAPGESGDDSRPVGQGDVCLSPDGKFVLGGSGEEGLQIWDISSTISVTDKMLMPLDKIPGPGQGRASVVAYNHRFNLICTADKDLTVWLPDPDAAD